MRKRPNCSWEALQRPWKL